MSGDSLSSVRELVAAVHPEPYLRMLQNVRSTNEAVLVLKFLLRDLGYADVTRAFDAAVERNA
jgi:hypothetical protein